MHDVQSNDPKHSNFATELQGTAGLPSANLLRRQTRRRIRFLDTLRFAAAAAVLMQHTVEHQGPRGAKIAALLSPGVFGVVLFFVISGFVIPMGAKNGLNLTSFAIRRFFRIYPLVLVTFMILSILSGAALVPALSSMREAAAWDWLANLLLVQDYVGARTLWGVTWTLSLEVAWYALFALGLGFIGPRFDDLASIIAPAVMLSLAALSLIIEHRLPLGRAGMIYAAIIGCRFYRYETGAAYRRRVMIDLSLFLLTMSICNVVSFGFFKHPNITMDQAVYPWLAAPILFAFVALSPKIRTLPIVNCEILGWFGSISFSIYMLHVLAIDIARDFAPGEYFIASALSLTFLFSVTGYYLVEVPGQQLGRWIEEKFLTKRNL